MGDLREALEKLAEGWRYKGEFGWGPWQEGQGPDPEGYFLDGAASELRKVLADHPAPVQMKVPDEIVDTAVNAYLHDPGDDPVSSMRAALEAVGHRTLLDRERVLDLLNAAYVRPSMAASTVAELDEYRSGLATAITGLARPMPTREQIGEALSTHYHDPVFGCECTPTRDDYTKVELEGGWPEHLADIVLGLLNGTDS